MLFTSWRGSAASDEIIAVPAWIMKWGFDAASASAGVKAAAIAKKQERPKKQDVTGNKTSGRVCDLTGKRANNGYNVTFSHTRNKKMQQVNLQYKRVYWPEGQRWVKLRICSKVTSLPFPFPSRASLTRELHGVGVRKSDLYSFGDMERRGCVYMGIAGKASTGRLQNWLAFTAIHVLRPRWFPGLFV